MNLHPTIFFLIFQIIFFTNLSGQCWDPGPFPPALDSFYTRINQAELLIAENNFDSAIAAYKRASQFEPLDFNDRINLLQCCLQTGRMPEAVSVIIQMAEDNYPLVFLNAKKYLDLINDENWIYYVEHDYKAPPEYPVRAIIKSTWDDFQKINFKNKDSTKIIYHEISNKMKRMILQYDYPSKQALGYGGSMYQSSLYDPVLMFFVVVNDSTFNVDSVFQDQLFRGKMSSSLIANYNKLRGILNCGCAPFNNAIYFEYKNKLYSCTKDSELAVNKCRKLLHLSTVAEAKKLIDYQSKNPQFQFKITNNAGSSYIRIDESGLPFDIDAYSDKLEFVKELGPNDYHFSK